MKSTIGVKKWEEHNKGKIEGREQRDRNNFLKDEPFFFTKKG